MARTSRPYENLLRKEFNSWLQHPSGLSNDVVRYGAEGLFVSIGTIEDYLKILDHCGSEANFSARICLGSREELLPKLAELVEAGFPKPLLDRLGQGDPTVHDELALFLLRNELHRKKTPLGPHAASRGKTFKRADINFLVALMIEQCGIHGSLPNSLVYLNSLRLLGENNIHRRDYRFHRFAMTIFASFRECLKAGTKATLRSLAEMVGAEHTSLARHRDLLKKHWDVLSDETGEYWLFADERSEEGPLPEYLKAGPIQFPDL